MRKLIKKFTSPLQRFRDIVRRELALVLIDAPKINDFDLNNCKKILFIRNDAKLGDSIVSSGVIRKLRKYRPDMQIIVMTTPAMSSLFKNSFSVDEVISLSKRPSYREIKKVCQNLGEIDVVVSLNNDMKMKDIYLLKKLNSQINIGLDQRVRLINKNIRNKVESLHYAKKFNYIAQCLGIEGQEEPYIIPLEEQSLNKIKTYLDNNQIEHFVLINPFGSGSTRKLNKENISQIIKRVREYNNELKIIILSAPDTSLEINEMKISDGENVYHFDQSESIYDAIALVRYAQIVISVDTAIVHIGTGLAKPQISIYKDDVINYQNWGPNSDLAESVFTTKDINQLNLDDITRSLNRITSS